MTYIITTRTRESILMASDTRLNYHYDKEIKGEKYQEIVAVADCIRKTFFIQKAKLGIQFLGIGYFANANGEKRPLSYFINKLYSKKYGENFKINAQIIFDFLKTISKEGDTGKYIKGIMTGFSKNNKAYICTFNTYNNDFKTKEFKVKQSVDSENNTNIFPITNSEAIEEINKRINEASKKKYWNIGGPVEILEINREEGRFVQKNTKLFDGSQKELVSYFKNDISKINGRIFKKPYLKKYHF